MTWHYLFITRRSGHQLCNSMGRRSNYSLNQITCIVKKFFSFISLVVLVVSSCSVVNDSPLDLEEQQSEVSIQTLVAEIYENDPAASYEDVEQYVITRLGISYEALETKSDDNNISNISEEALHLVSELQQIDPSLFSSKDDYLASLMQIAVDSKPFITQEEFDSIEAAILISAEVIELKYGNDVETKGFKSWVKQQWEDWGRCAAGIVGGAGLGALAGAGIASIPTCGIRAGAGAIIGGISGALSGAAASC